MKIFGIDEEDGKSKAYVRLYIPEFVALDNKAYEVSSTTGEAIVYFTKSTDGIKLEKIEWSEDGEGHNEWIIKNFPDEFKRNLEDYYNSVENVNQQLQTEVNGKASEVLGVPIETENIIEIDLDNKTYKIIKTHESGNSPDDYKFETETVKEGKF